jgi:hypothetical protein
VTAAAALISESTTIAQTTGDINTRYLMTVNLPIDLSPVVDSGLEISRGPAEGWVKGGVIGGILVPSRDWIRIIPSDGSHLRLDARVAIETDEHEIIYMNYSSTLATADRLCKGDVLKADDCYLLSAPAFETASERYSWLNNVQTIGQMVEFNVKGGYLIYDLFVVSEPSTTR